MTETAENLLFKRESFEIEESLWLMLVAYRWEPLTSPFPNVLNKMLIFNTLLVTILNYKKLKIKIVKLFKQKYTLVSSLYCGNCAKNGDKQSLAAYLPLHLLKSGSSVKLYA